ncbi:MAG: YqaA family protein [Desulfovibrionales bacterium]
MRSSIARASDWLGRLNKSQRPMWLLFILSFLETTVLPVPIEVVLVPFLIANQHRLWKTASFVTAGCIAGAMTGYAVGFFLYGTVGTWILSTMGWESAYHQFRDFFDQHGFFAVLAVGILPIPFQTAMIAAGVAKYPIWKFVIATAISRGIRYYGLAGLVALFGERAYRIWVQHRVITMAAAVLMLAAAWAVSQWLGGKIP